MRRLIPKMLHCAERVIASETRSSRQGVLEKPPISLACGKMAKHLIPLMGNGGYRALLTRGLTLASEEFPWLSLVHPGDDGTLECQSDAQKVDPKDFLEGSVVLLATLLTLLETFVGENLTMHLAGQMWPDAPISNLDSETGDSR
jgi:hypothetical protein